MDKIGTSHIVSADVVVVMLAVYLVGGLYYLPPNTFWSRALAVLCGCIVGATPFVVIFANLGSGGSIELSIVAMILCLALWRRHQEAKEENAESAETTATVPRTPIHL